MTELTADLSNDSLHLKRSEAVLSSDFDDGVMMMDIDGGSYFQIDSIGGRVWALLETPTNIGTICTALTREYDVDAETCRNDVRAFLQRLQAEGLIAPA